MWTSPLSIWLWPHRKLSQDKLPLDLGFFEFVYNLKSRGKRLLSSPLGACPEIHIEPLGFGAEVKGLATANVTSQKPLASG
jgi:hypothetical protein